ncbi:hypothetical protein [Viridibacillus arvi]|uniref:hypothetical protein n=1 Tax=Viridibacillus arvi TaxID=263475 RepID=UPI0034CD069D
MIRKLENGNTLITLGEGTAFTGNIYADDDKKPFGIFFTNQQTPTIEDGAAVIIQLTSDKAIASYLMALTKYLEAHTDTDMKEFHEAVQKLKKELEPFMPKLQVEEIS